ncbi:hypothetical protein AB6F62_16550 [Providencia huaxiensis]|uniref:hypothetical protein n=1 Tax=Providencia huaxiensis TaxID=2027290 RepID=UPI0034DD736D
MMNWMMKAAKLIKRRQWLLLHGQGWRIRQFQFKLWKIVTVYRELRKMADHDTAVGLDVEFGCCA